jgi:ABC-type transport system involved in cytochrome c biogenesis ATPase subunit
MKIDAITITGLFDRFDHHINFDRAERVRIMHAPNGFGKTMILRIVNTLLSRPPRQLAHMPFRTATITFDDSSSLSAMRSGNDATVKTDVKLIYRNKAGSEKEFRPDRRIRPNELTFPVGIIEDIIPELDQIGQATWRHIGSGETLSLEDVLEQYEDQLPQNDGDIPRTPPEWLKEIRSQVSVRFISAERLTQRRSYRDEMARYHRVQRFVADERTVTRYSDELADQVRKTITGYGALAQSLDRTFPARLVSEPPPSDLTVDVLKEDLAEVDSKRARLVEAGLLKQEFDAWNWNARDLDLDKVDESKRGVLAVYARDAKEKLSVFDKLFTRVDALKRIANSRFLEKKVTVGERGLGVVTLDGRNLSLEMLSSGEQHELVLLYDLLFRADNSFILIDEPELSFHVAWQAAFLSDLEEIAQISQFQALLATHSPQIIGDRWDLTIELKGAPQQG